MTTKMVRVYPDDVPLLNAVRMFLQKQDGKDKTLADAVRHCIQSVIAFDSIDTTEKE